MTQKEKHEYMRVSMNLIGINANDRAAAVLVSVYELLLQYKGEVNIKQILTIEKQMVFQYEKQDSSNDK